MSVYQSNGKPLSQQALYQQKQRQGVYSTPGKPSVGVASSASDAAALLAASSDLSVKPSYERLQAAPDAHAAALAAKKEPITAWSRETTDASADAAASNARYTPAASSTKSDLGVPLSYNKGSIYKRATANSTATMTSRTTPEKLVSKHGLSSKPSAATTLDIGKISQIADKNSSSTLNKRFNPEQDYRHGIPIKPAEFLTEDEEKMAAQSAGRSLTMKHGGGYTDSVSSQKRTSTFKALDVVDATLLAAANKKAAERLSSLSLTGGVSLREQAQLYSKALVAAQKNSEDRLKAHKAGMIDLGGGLSLPSSEVDKLANLIVAPVLEDLGTKATAQREADQVKAEKQSELKKLHLKFKKEDESRKIAEKVQRLKEKDARIAANEEKKKGEDEKLAAYQAERNTEVDGKNTELKELKAKFATEKEDLLSKKKANEDRITEEETGLIKGRKDELETMQKEKDEILQPTLEELEVESGKLKELTDSKDQLSSEVESGKKLKAEREAKIAELKEKLEKTKASIESATKEHEDYLSKREATDKEVSELQESTTKALEGAEASHKELDEEITNLEKEKEEHISTKASHKKEILLEIDEKVKGEHAINKELPEHMQEEIDEDKVRDTGSLFSVDESKAAKKEAKIEETKVENKEPVVPKAVKKDEVPTTKKKGLRSRLINAFKTPVRPEPQAKRSPATVGNMLGKSESKASKVENQESSEISNYEEEISLRDNQKGGVFKEEI